MVIRAVIPFALSIVVALVGAGCSPTSERVRPPGTFAATSPLVRQESDYVPRLSYRTGSAVAGSVRFSTTYDQGEFGRPKSDTPNLPSRVFDRKANARTLLSDLPSDKDASLTIILNDIPFDWDSVSKQGGSSRTAALGNLKALQRASQEDVREFLAANGVGEIEDFSIVNHLLIRGTPALARKILLRDDVVDVQTSTVGHPSAYYSGLETGIGTRIANLYSAGYSGSVGHSSSFPVRIGLIEVLAGVNPSHVGFNPSHVGWKTAGGTSRIISTLNCASVGCPSYTPSSSSGSSDHATVVAMVAAGSIQQGQDSNFSGTNTSAQKQRSGHTGGTNIYLYSAVGSSDAVKRAIDRAVLDQVDVLNMSFYLGPTGSCDPTTDYSGINAALTAAKNAGILIVGSAGNNDHTLGCTLNWPTNRNEVITVSGLDSNDTTTPYGSLSMWYYSSGGPMATRKWDANWVTAPSVDLMAPACVGIWFQNGTNNYDTSGSFICGTSLASPTVAAAGAALRHSFYSIGWPYYDSRGLAVNLLAMGDGWDAFTNSYPLSGGPTPWSGGGRLRMRAPTAGDMTGPWGWGWHAFSIAQGQTVTWPVWDGNPESSSITEWKWAAMWDEPDLLNVADIDFYVYNTCPSGGGAAVKIADDTGYALRTHFRLGSANVGGKCLEMRAYGYSVPPGGRTVYTADFFHSGTP